MLFKETTIAILFSLAGLALFIFSAKTLSNSLKNISDNRFKKIITNIAKNRFLAMLFGVIFTSLIQSSDGAMALIMGLLAAGFIDLKGGIAFLLGANIGTATTSLIVAFQSQFAFTEYFMLFMVLGIFGLLLIKKEKLSHVFLILFSIGAIFLSLKLMSSGAKQIVVHPSFQEFVKVVGVNPWSSFGFSFLLTGLMQSSSATVTLFQLIYNAPDAAIDLPVAIALVFGANVGTTITGLILAFTGKNNNSKKIALIWGFTNLSISLLILPFLYPLTYYADFIKWMIPNSKTLQLSIAHLLFNIILVSIFIWLIKYIIIIVNKIIKEKNIPQKYSLILPDELLTQSPVFALQASKKALLSFGNMTLEGINLIDKYCKTGDNKVVEEYEKLVNIVEQSRKELYHYLIKISSNHLDKDDAKTHMALILSSRSLDKIMNIGQEVINELTKVKNNKKNASPFIIEEDIIMEIQELLKWINASFKNSLEQINSYDRERTKFLEKLTKNIDILSHEFARSNINRLKEVSGQIQLEYDFDYSRLLRSLERIAHHSLRVNNYVKNSKQKIKSISSIEQTNYIDINNK